MSNLQQAGARKLLDVISRTYPKGKLLTYGEAAEKIGRPRNHARAVAQMCDLLDAAAAYARTPLLALVAIRSDDGQVNPNAWKKDVRPGLREKIVSRSLKHEFGLSDYEFIGHALQELSGLGNREAWKFVRSQVSDTDLFAAIAGTASSARATVVHTPTVDPEFEAVEGNRRLISHLRRERRPELIKRKKVASRTPNGGLTCEACGENSCATYAVLRSDPWEVHHRHPLSHARGEVRSRLEDLAILCPNCHRAIHRTHPMMTVERFKKRYF